ncbi:AMP-binding protein [Dactylosporangium sp. NPDC050688]|uniref:AMP-binding enzyme n=1 Tax=Dactylosporangium sp. NPDC050688 TaxID=3157217 RepID=UPI0033C79B46
MAVGMREERAAVICAPDQVIDRSFLERDGFGLRQIVPPGGTVVVASRGALPVAAVFAALDGWAARVDLVGPEGLGSAPDSAVVLVDDLGAHAAVMSGTAPPPGEAATRWRLRSSGTTGAGKTTDHSISALARTVRRPDGPGSAGAYRWGLLYPPTRMAGVQVVLQALFGGESVVDAAHLAGLEQRLEWFAAWDVNALSATPTLWRQILQLGHASGLRLKQATLGGEIADQRLLDAMGDRFGCRVSHVFASTEAGVAFSVSDGRAGFPRAFLHRGPRGIRLEIRDGVLHVHNPGSSRAEPDGFVSTGDRVTVVDDRVHFEGRVDGVVNVGGETVVPERVEEALRRHPRVHDALVVPRRNAFSGWILHAEVVPDGAEDGQLAGELRRQVREELGPAHVPARVVLVSQLRSSTTGKALRQ